MGAAALMLGAPVRGVAAQSPIRPEAERLADDLFLIRNDPGEAHVIAHTSSAGVLLVDGGSAGGADRLMQVIGRLPNTGPVHTLFNTHWHPEQTGLNERIG